jgi:YjjG family noncanonical pyrimidine nucleotidase
MAEPRYRLVLFDVDDTLLDFHASEDHAINLCWNQFFREAVSLKIFAGEFREINVQVWSDVERGKLKPPQVSYERARRTLRHFGLRPRPAEQFGELFADGLSQVAQWLPHAEAGFKSIAGRYKVGLVTNGLTLVQHPRIDCLSIRKLLSTVQVSEEVGISKPRAEIFWKAMDEVGVSAEQTLMVGDSVSSDFQGAINAGVDFCWVRRNSHALPMHFSKPRYHVTSLRELDVHLV